jgi:2-polyprenyl-3-methyl-5-hydroxy-6-metoxy-1,4-benzoquinol methylase
VFLDRNRVVRRVDPAHAAWVEEFLETSFFRDLVRDGVMPVTSRCSAPNASELDASPALWLEHERVELAVYAHEWIADQLFAAGLLTIDLAIEAADGGLELKDATPYNVLMSKGRAVFCDVLTFVKRSASPLWPPYGQFQRNFVLPLYMHRHYALPPHRVFLERRDGIEPAEALPAVPWYRRLYPLELQLVTLPALLTTPGPAQGAAASHLDARSARSDFVFKRSLERLRRQLLKLRPSPRRNSAWAGYEAQCDHYSSADRERKHEFVQRALAQTKPARVLDLGANAGEYSRVAAKGGAHVVAADADLHALQVLHRRNERERLPISPLVLNLARPTPALGWRNREFASFLDRARGQFDMVLALALLHHVIVTERVPLDEFVALLADLQSPQVVLEWVSPQDMKFRQIAGMNAHLYAELDESALRRALAPHFDVVAEVELSAGLRRLFWCARRTP